MDPAAYQTLLHKVLILYFSALPQQHSKHLQTWGTHCLVSYLFGFFIQSMRFSRQVYQGGLPFPPPEDHVLSEPSAMTCPSWVTLHGMTHSFIELCKPLHHDKAVIHEGDMLMCAHTHTHTHTHICKFKFYFEIILNLQKSYKENSHRPISQMLIL